MKCNYVSFTLSFFVLILLQTSIVLSNHIKASNNNNAFFKNTSEKSKSSKSSKIEGSDLSSKTKSFIRNSIKKHNNPNMKSSSTIKKATITKKPASFNPFYRKQNLVSSTKNTYEGWLSLQSETLNDSNVYPSIPGLDGITAKIPTNTEGRVINKVWKRDSSEIPSKFFLWARIKDKYIYFTNTKSELNVLVYISLLHVKSVDNLNDGNYCLQIAEKKNIWKLCADSQANVNKWVCLISSTIRALDLEEECSSDKIISSVATKIKEREIIQPFIIIPTPQEYCNAQWDFESNGKDWKCLCKDGKEQSPIDLPPPKKAIDSPSKPIFDYKKVSNTHLESGLEGKVKANTSVQIEHYHNALRIFHTNFGRIVTLDGTIYQAEEIVFHTPSEHTIDGKKFPLEMRVIHRAITKSDFGKKAALSFLFTGKAGVYNKFVDALDFFSLPNPYTRARNIYEKLFINNILLNTDDIESSLMMPFSFYTYSGSMTEPPCEEKVIHYVASEPIEMSITAIELFKEALRQPDFEDSYGNVLESQKITLNNSRTTQPLNGRAVFHYDHVKFGFPTFKKSASDYAIEIPRGHYEKQIKESTEYIYVEGKEPSSIPGAIVVSDDEANNA